MARTSDTGRGKNKLLNNAVERVNYFFRSPEIMANAFFARWAAIACICCIFFFHPPTAATETVTGAEYAVKAGFIYNFANFVTWPDAAFKNSPDTMVLCFVSDSPESEILYKLNGKTIKGRKLKVQAYEEGNCVDQSHILFFGTQDATFIQPILARAKDRSILTIGEVEGFTRMGGVINFFKDQNRLRFKVNVDTAKRLGLKLSSQILVSAKIVHGENE